MLQFNLLPSSAQSQVGVLFGVSEDALEKKVCRGPCGLSLPLDAFGKSKEGKWGYRSKCNKCRAAAEKDRRATHPSTEEQKKAACARTRAWAKANPERVKANALKTYQANPERAKSAAKAWQKRNPEKVKKINSAWASRNRTKTRAYARDWQANNRELYHEIQKEWRIKNQTYWRVRDAAIRKATSNFTLAQWLEVLEEFGHRCAYCLCDNQKLTMDHIISIARGGEHTRENIVPACKPCNSRKKDRSIFYMLEAKGV